ncbi:UDP-glycosyltransferase UGT5 [Nomia melanderi]|uniref:UDP-glycosyltransferase UGT5 n=1 Tax=Nomia melanderi TaxID=2448451 RepID=UPI0013040AE9|nr:UDP-glucuronosyltransferase 2B31-like [Nomia melanderi]
MKLFGLICLWAVLTTCQGYRILGLFPFNGKSHFVMFEQMMKALARKGHHVDVVSTFPLKKPYKNYNDLVALKASWQFLNNMTFNDMKTMLLPGISQAVAHLCGNEVCKFLSHPRLQELVKNPPKDPPYDVVFVEIFGAHCFIAIGHLLKVPVIGVSSATLYPWHNDIIGNPENLAFAPNNLLSFSQPMSFLDRTYNFLHTTYHKLNFQSYASKQTEIIREYFGEDMPDIRTLERSVAMIFVNSFRSINGIKDSTPGYIEVGGVHVQEDGVEVSPSLEKWMNESTSGFFYLSFGSMIKIESFPIKFLNVLYKSLGKLAPVRVLMKIPSPNELPPGLPKNILTSPWIPQLKVLKHPNIKGFITHGGLMGTQEAIHYGVPLIGIPLFADQFINIKNYVQQNIAIEIDHNTLTEEKMDNALNAVLHDPKYRESARKLSKMFLDRPMNTTETVVYWTEYIIRHGADALRSPSMDLTWWQVQLLDVYVFLLFVALLSIILLISAMRFAFSMISVEETDSHKKKIS